MRTKPETSVCSLSIDSEFVSLKPLTSLGRFLKGVLHDLYIWYKDEKAFDASTRREVDGKTVYLPGLSKPFVRDGPATADGLLKWNEFKSFLRKCHRRIGSVSSFDHTLNGIHRQRPSLSRLQSASKLEISCTYITQSLS